MKRRNQMTQRGFTLVEMAIVMVTIGGLLAVLLKGQELYHNVQVRSVYSEVQAIKQGYTAFRSKYNAVPGDMTTATTQLGNCTGACGNGVVSNSFIGRPNAKINDAISTSGEDLENIRFFQQLQAAGLLKGVDTQASTSSPEWGKLAPKAGSAQGGLVVKSINQDLCVPATGQVADMTGTWLVWQKDPLAAAHESTVVPSRDARMLDEKYDDGLPGSGDIRAGGANTNPMATTDGCRSDLKTYDAEGSCYMYFRISRGN